ncbi:MAG: hypothetical protein FWD23_15035 [Oscillospiraceae bacterium]|nr:hypothetical protein [Oscillospiraceae bacterium]
MIKWCKKVPQELISRLYNQSVSGIEDDELIDEVGWALYARCESIISATNGFEQKRLICLICGKDIPLSGNIFDCPCGFRATWEEFKKSYTGKQLHAANALPIFLAYRRDFPKAETYGEKLVCIDVLIHSFHISMSYYKELDSYDTEDENVALNRPVGANLIEGSLLEVILFLDKLSALPDSKEKERWQKIAPRANGGEVLNRKEAMNEKPADINSDVKIKWAPRVKKAEIREVYKANAQGLDDEVKIDNLGIALYLRCVDILCVKRARSKGGIRCQSCYLKEGTETYIEYNESFHKGMPEVTIICPVCGFAFTNTEFYKSVKDKQLNSGGAVPAFEHYVKYFPVEKEMGKKMLLIDQLINSFHYHLLKNMKEATRSVVPNLIEGKPSEALAFLDELGGL